MSAARPTRTRPCCLWVGFCFAFVVGLLAQTAVAQDTPGLTRSEFVFESAPFEQCHASTIEETPDGLIVAWFGGTREGNDDVEIWTSEWKDDAWTAPVSVADGIESTSKRYPCWNPVLLREDKKLYLFYKVGPNPRQWWGMVKSSDDFGKTWSEAARLPDGQLGPIKNKVVVLESGRWLCGSSTEHDGWRLHMEWTDDQGETWHRTGPLNPKGPLASIQPTLLTMADGGLRMLCRSQSARGITTATSQDDGETWTDLTTLGLPNNNSGLDAVTLADGRHLLVYNHLERGRHQLHVAVSQDGLTWKAALLLEDALGQEFSYPAVIQTDDGKVHVTYTWKRQRIKHCVIDPDQLELRPIVDGQWPSLRP